MGQFRDDIQDILDRLDPTDGLDILLIALVTYWVFLLLRGTAAIALLRGAAIILVGAVILAQVLDLEVLNFVIRNSLTGLIIAVPIIFQPEIRRALERVGRTGSRVWARPAYDDLIDTVRAVPIARAETRGAGQFRLPSRVKMLNIRDGGTRFPPQYFRSRFVMNFPVTREAIGRLRRN